MLNASSYCQKSYKEKKFFFRQPYTTGHGSDILTPSVQAQQQPQETSWHPVVVRLLSTLAVFSTMARQVTSPTWVPHFHVNRS